MKTVSLYESIYGLAELLAKANEEFRHLWIPMRGMAAKDHSLRTVQFLQRK
ncbi:hypothetical protein SDC9_180800 [bioreactor metagenome]|jgi:hypothetical protein|uniref:Uncharacterized protein n=1 Tax=bioreactor metagenome TaxID=1076179 RepID=A0A645H2R0_9ZZZZ